MLRRLIQFALTQRVFILLLLALLAVGGGLAWVNLPIDAFPDVSAPQVKVIVKAPGMTPREVEQRITAPIEVEMLGIPKQTMLRSVAKYAVTVVTVDFEEGTDIYWARQQVSERLSGIWDQLPAGVSGGMAPLTTPLGEMFMFTLEGGDLSLAERRTLLDWTVRPALRTVPGVADVNSLGGTVRTFEIVPDNARMNARGVALSALKGALLENNRNDGAGRLVENEEALLVRSEGSINNLDDVRDIVVQTTGNIPVRISDVAEVRIGALTRYGAVIGAGRGEVVQGLVLGLRGANARTVVQDVKAKLAELEKGFPEGVHARVFYDRSDLVRNAVDTVRTALSEAIVLVLALLVVLLGNLRAALTVALILPFSALITFILMRQFGLSANLMSLGGLAIAIGILVDAAVVVVENIVAQLEAARGSRLPRLHIIQRAAREVAVPVTSGILIIIIVFLPLLTLQGLEGKLFIPVALTIVFALASSLLLSLTAIPVLSSMLIGKVSHKEPVAIRALRRVYEPTLRWSLAHGRTVFVAALLALAATGLVFTQIGKTFMPTMDEGTVVIQTEKLPSISLEESLAIDQRIAAALKAAVPDVEDIVARTGSDELGMDPMGLNETDMFLQLKPRDQWQASSKEDLLASLRQVMQGFAGVNFAFTQPIQMRVSEMLTGVRGDVAVKIIGTDLNALNEQATELATLLESIDGALEVIYTRNEGVQYLKVDIDRLAAGRAGLSVDTVEQLLRAQLEGSSGGTVYEGIRRTPLMIRGSEALRRSPSEFESLRIPLDSGGLLPVRAVAKMQRVEEEVKIERELAQRMAVVAVNVGGRDLVGFVEEARRKAAAQLRLPAGYYLEWSGEFENQQRAAKRLSIVVPASIVLIFLLLFTTFRSVTQAILVLLNIPFAMIGGVFALWISGEYLSVPASVGFIALLGIAVLNGVVMLSYFNQLRALGMPVGRVVVEGAQRRLRPVMMTASIAAFGLVPLLFATGPGSEIQRPLAIVVIGGLVTSTLLTLVLLPVLYRRFGETKVNKEGEINE